MISKIFVAEPKTLPPNHSHPFIERGYNPKLMRERNSLFSLYAVQSSFSTTSD
jgi:hypothetical protein